MSQILEDIIEMMPSEQESDHISSAVDTTDAGADVEGKFVQEKDGNESNILASSLLTLSLMSSAEQQEEADHYISTAVDTSDAGADVEEKCQQEEEENESNLLASSNHQTAGSTNTGNVDAIQKNTHSVWYAAPKYWQNVDSTSHHNDDDEWEHLFLDLFYVPAISNLSELLASAMDDPEVHQVVTEVGIMRNFNTSYNLRGGAMLCFFAVFFAVWYSWYHQCVYECKFIARDTFHLFLNRGRLIFVAISIYQISGYEEFVGAENELAFYFCLGITFECFISLCLRVETLIMTRDNDGVVRKDCNNYSIQAPIEMRMT